MLLILKLIQGLLTGAWWFGHVVYGSHLNSPKWPPVVEANRRYRLVVPTLPYRLTNVIQLFFLSYSLPCWYDVWRRSAHSQSVSLSSALGIQLAFGRSTRWRGKRRMLRIGASLLKISKTVGTEVSLELILCSKRTDIRKYPILFFFATQSKRPCLLVVVWPRLARAHWLETVPIIEAVSLESIILVDDC